LAYIPKKVTTKNKSTYKVGKKNYSGSALWQEATLKKIKR
jgi:hypothetical protein